ncbi:hypothetical protein CNR22_14065 [Sphingobacteriaceae bacterium]|nr:hypothetical protein CNR22_14065 [Sphingobacteriaceae bacterium]
MMDTKNSFIGNEQRGEEKYNYLFANLPVAMCTCDTEGYITGYNVAAATLWGAVPAVGQDKWCGSAKMLMSDGYTEIPREKSPMARFLNKEKQTDKEIIIEKPGGERSYVQTHLVPTYDLQGKLSGAINMLTNVTEQRLAQKAIDENQLLFRTISNSAPVGLWMTNAQAKCSYVNQTWVNWTGISLEQALSEGWFKRVLDDDKSDMLNQFHTAFEKREYFSGEFRLNRADGELRWCLTEGYPFKNIEGEFKGYTGSVTDITDRKIAQNELEKIIAERTKSLIDKNEELKKSEEKYHRMTEEVQDYAIILLDKEGTILNWNNGARKIKGYHESEIVGKNFRIFYLQEDLDSCLPEKLISSAVESGRAVHEGWRKRNDGTKFWGSIVITALHDEKENIIGFSKVTRDLTERKKSEDTMRQYMTELEKQNIELEQFAYVSSHDLQEPLRKIRTFSNLLEGEVENVNHRNYLQKINSSAARMSELIKDLLSYSQLNKEEKKFVPVNMNQILENVKTDLELVIAQKNAIIVNDEFPMVEGLKL